MSNFGHFDEELQALDKRIGRLALLSGADLSQSEIVAQIIKGNFSACQNGSSTHETQLKELRALLMMKYHIEVSCIDSLGAAQCAKLIAEHDEQMRRSGFPPHTVAE